MVGRLLHAAVYLVSAALLLALAVAGGALVYLGLFHRPPYLAWSLEGPTGGLAAVLLVIGIVLWAALAVSALIWCIRCLKTVAVTLVHSDG